MLVLSRQRDEEIVIGNDIVIKVVDIRGDKVRLGIVAPTNVPVHRREVYDAIQRQNGVDRKQEELSKLKERIDARKADERDSSKSEGAGEVQA